MNFVEQPTTGGSDLHLHSHNSDGSLSPRELLQHAEQANLSVISLTDHDTVAGLDKLMKLARDSTVEVVPGIELSCQIEQGRYHILGYFIDWEHPPFQKRLRYFEEQRKKRVRKMVEVIQEHLHSDLSYEDVSRHCHNSLIGKPHVAKAMAEADIVDNRQQAFDEYLAKGELLDQVPKERMGVREAIRAIEEVGGVPILAHPVHYDESVSLQWFSELGVRGVEVYYSDQTDSQQREYFSQAADLGLLVTGGSDFHGEAKPEVSIGDIRLPDECFDKLIEAARRAGARHDFLSNL